MEQFTYVQNSKFDPPPPPTLLINVGEQLRINFGPTIY